MKLPEEAAAILRRYGVDPAQPYLAVSALLAIQAALVDLDEKLTEHLNEVSFAVVLIGKDRDGTRVLNECRAQRKKDPAAVPYEPTMAIKTTAVVYTKAPPEKPRGRGDAADGPR